MIFSLSAHARALGSRAHCAAGAAVAALGLGHAGWFLLGEPVIAVDLRAGGRAPLWAGVAALGLLTTLVWQQPLRSSHRRGGSHHWHRRAALAALGVTLWHAAGAGHDLRHAYQVALLLGLCGLWLYLGLAPRAGTAGIAVATGYLVLAGTATLAFAALRNPPS
ncbi:MAG: hypothetical protein U5L11_16730 [Arhodomonas sp.]|nr:hypothetical protein [Arhodomonas sp.]